LALLVPSQVSKYFSGFATWQNITLGGVGRDGRDATNELSHLILETDGDVALQQPETVIRVHRDMPRNFLIKACEVAKKWVSIKGANRKLVIKIEKTKSTITCIIF
jgi:formate C-acetyltransferase